jgi:uncharacterized integral membrane protein
VIEMVEQERPDSPDTDEIPVQTPAPASPAESGWPGAGSERAMENRPERAGETGPATTTKPVTRPGSTPVTGKSQEYRKVRRTRFSGLWVGATIAAVVLLILLVFIIQNSQQAAISFFGAHWHLPLGVSLLLAAICGVLLVAIPGYGRIIQLRRALRRTTTDTPAAPSPRREKDAGHSAQV